MAADHLIPVQAKLEVLKGTPAANSLRNLAISLKTNCGLTLRLKNAVLGAADTGKVGEAVRESGCAMREIYDVLKSAVDWYKRQGSKPVPGWDLQVEELLVARKRGIDLGRDLNQIPEIWGLVVKSRDCSDLEINITLADKPLHSDASTPVDRTELLVGLRALWKQTLSIPSLVDRIDRIGQAETYPVERYDQWDLIEFIAFGNQLKAAEKLTREIRSEITEWARRAPEMIERYGPHKLQELALELKKRLEP